MAQVTNQPLLTRAVTRGLALCRELENFQVRSHTNSRFQATNYDSSHFQAEGAQPSAEGLQNE